MIEFDYFYSMNTGYSEIGKLISEFKVIRNE